MGEFFKGWRRKVGLATLAMALVFLVLWFRSQTVIDSVSYDGFDDYHSIETGGGNILWTRKNVRTEIHMRHEKQQVTFTIRFACTMRPDLLLDTRPYQAEELELPADYQYSVQRRLIGAEFSIAHREERSDDETVITMLSFWKLSLLWLVLPPTLLSAWLILVKPRTTKTVAIAARVESSQ